MKKGINSTTLYIKNHNGMQV
uniref:Uncharacterized protein n=1 Tax=Rhizophora mucronata TaxID=61149 RepID=A0A2P2NS49_RHIMU